jgi:hypothetical protein
LIGNTTIDLKNFIKSITSNSTILEAIAKGLNSTVLLIQTNQTLPQRFFFRPTPTESPTAAPFASLPVRTSKNQHSAGAFLLLLLLLLIIPLFCLIRLCYREVSYKKNKTSSVLRLQPLRTALKLAGAGAGINDGNLFSGNQTGILIVYSHIYRYAYIFPSLSKSMVLIMRYYHNNLYVLIITLIEIFNVYIFY